jgi:hypothetical protein
LYTAYAAQCHKMADESTDDVLRESWLNLAASWLRLATSAETELDLEPEFHSLASVTRAGQAKSIRSN